MKFKNLLQRKTPRKIFCISMQRSGTSSVGRFFQDHNIPWAGWPADRDNNWTRSILDGDLEAVFDSQEFKRAQGFEDSPWFYPGLFKILYHRFPGSKFILLTRDPEAWFQSMRSHRYSEGFILGAHKGHSLLYRRESEYYDLLDQGELEGLAPYPDMRFSSRKDREKMTLHSMGAHYKEIYQIHTREVVDFFSRNDPNALYAGSLDDSKKWIEIGQFLGIEVDPEYDTHENKTPQ